MPVNAVTALSQVVAAWLYELWHEPAIQAAGLVLILAATAWSTWRGTDWLIQHSRRLDDG